MLSETKNNSAWQTFNPEKFIRNTLFKDLELKMCEIFGFKHVSFQHVLERYIGNGKFKTFMLNAYTYPTWRYPIDGLVTDDGFYDKTHSIELTIVFCLEILRNFTPEEIVAIFLHEFGHNIDPALVDIKFVKTNKLVEYIEGKYPEKKDGKQAPDDNPYGMSLIEILLTFVGGIGLIIYFIRNIMASLDGSVMTSPACIFLWLHNSSMQCGLPIPMLDRGKLKFMSWSV